MREREIYRERKKLSVSIYMYIYIRDEKFKDERIDEGKD
jgi:hypothetical protein